jgi:hypothetical protein
MLPLSTARQTIGRIDALIGRLADPVQKSRLKTMRDHMWGEMINDLDLIMGTMSAGPIHYTFDGHDFIKVASTEINSLKATRQMYAASIQAGLVMSGGIDEHQVSFGENAITHRGIATLVFPGMALNLEKVEPEAYYLVRWWLMASVPFDEQGFIAGEHLINGKPLLIERVEREATNLLLDGPFPATWLASKRPAGERSPRSFHGIGMERGRNAS